MCNYEQTKQVAAWRTWKPKHRERPAAPSRRTGFTRFMEFVQSLERKAVPR